MPHNSHSRRTGALAEPMDRPKEKALLLLFLSSLLSAIPAVTSQINVWPKPRTLAWPTPEATHLSPLFKILSPSHPHLRPAVRRYVRLILSERHHPIRPVTVNLTHSPPLSSLKIAISDLSAPFQHGTSESYNLTIPKAELTAELTAETVWGAMRGLETFSQLIWPQDGRLTIPVGLHVRDGPLFPHRGVLLDTSRNFYPVEDLMRLIRAMSMNKMNVFHWHVTDSQSFPLVLESEPELGKKGSYGEYMRYNAMDVRRVVVYGMRHGVRVLPEIDTPGHAASWAEAYPDIVTCAGMFWSPARGEALASEPAPGQLNPLNPKTYRVLQNVIRDVTSIFPDNFYHAGADEIAPGCWKADPQIQQFLSNGGTLSELLEKFINSTHPYIASFNRTVVYWEDVLLNPTVKVKPTFLPPESTILQSWNNGPNNTKLIVAAGYRAIVSSSDFYYLDCGHGGFVGNDSRYDRQTRDDPSESFNYNGGNGGSWCGPFKTWQRIYDYDITHGLSEREAKLVLGGEVALWSEQADPTVLDSRVWPRGSAMAEALWSGNREEGGKKRYGEATDRLNEWRYRMVGRGIGAEPIQPLWCPLHPGMCDI